MTLYNAIELFMQEQNFRGNSTYTIEYYNNSLGLFKRWCAMDFDVEELCISNYNEFKLFLLKMNTITRISVNTYLRGVKAFLRYLAEEQYIDDFTPKIKLVKAERIVILPLSDVEIYRLLYLTFEDTILDIRNISIILLMLDSGLRRNEVVNLDISNINLNDKFLVAQGKGLKQRIVPFGNMTLKYLQKYIDLRGHSKGCFFLCRSGEPITNNAIKMVFQRLKEITGIGRLRPHLLRHTFATRYIINGGNLETLRILLGHSSINITQVYLHLATSQKILSMQHISLTDRICNTSPGTVAL